MVDKSSVSSQALSDALHSIGELRASGALSRATFDEILRAKGTLDPQVLKANLLDLTLAFVRECVEDHELSKTEISELENLITIFRIEEGEFYELRRDAIQEIMSAQAMWMLRDRYVTEEEEVLQRDLQRLFGLSYDQYVGLLRTLVGRHVETLESKKLVTHDSEELKSIDSSIRNLRGVFLVPR